MDALQFILPGVGTTLLVTVLAYIAAAIMGLALAGILLLKPGKTTLRNNLLIWLALILGSLWFFSRPQVDYVLVGDPEGLVAIIQGTPQNLIARVQEGTWSEEEVPGRSIRAVATPEAAVQRLEDGVVTAAFMPRDLAPAGLPVLWEAGFLPRDSRMPAMLLAVLAAILGVLIFAGWQSGKHPLAR